MQTFNFSVEDKTFQFDETFLEGSTFTVRSVPRPYEVLWEDKKTPASLAGELMADNPKNLMLIDAKVYDIYFKDKGFDEKRIFKIEATEENKTLQSVERVLKFLQENNFSKGETLIVVGGGITQDIGAFAGAVYKRGIPWILLPTTLLSMCDSCIGGKTGINYLKVKNQLALFSSPRKIIICPSFINTLDKREIKSGLGEILKLFITGGNNLLEFFKQNVKGAKVKDFSSYKQLILGALGVKKQIIEADEFELNLRKSLNYGHTLGHAVEVLSNYEIPHGQAVSLGMIIADKLSAENGLLPEEERLKLKALSRPLCDCKKIPVDMAGKLVSLLRNDKKASGGYLTFSFLKHCGQTVFVKLAIDQKLTNRIIGIIEEEINAL